MRQEIPAGCSNGFVLLDLIHVQGERSEWGSAPTLVPRDPGALVPRVRVQQSVMRMGRDPACDIVIAEPTVSRRHAKVSWDGHEFVSRTSDLPEAPSSMTRRSSVPWSSQAMSCGSGRGPSTSSRPTSHRARWRWWPSRAAGKGEVSGNFRCCMEVARALNAATVLDDVVHIVLQAAVRLLRADRGCLILVENGERRTVASYPRDVAETAWGQRSSCSSGPCPSAERCTWHGGVAVHDDGRPRRRAGGRRAAPCRQEAVRPRRGGFVHRDGRGHRRDPGGARHGR